MKNCMCFILLLSIFACNKEDVTCTDISYNKAFTAEVDKKYCIDDENFIVSDYKDVDFGNDKPHIIFTSLFCHFIQSS